MIRRISKRSRLHEKYSHIIIKYKIPRAFLSINRHAVAKGVLVGLFIAFIPMPGQMVAIVLLQPLLRFNLPLSIALVWITNPFTMPFIYFIEYKTGGLLLGMHDLPHVSMSLQWFQEHFDEIVLPLYCGAFFYSLLFSLSGCYVVHQLWIRSVRRHRRSQGKSDAIASGGSSPGSPS
ncbi:MAG: DUF2062 domain-containing protein [Campylobacterales bacterium]